MLKMQHEHWLNCSFFKGEKAAKQIKASLAKEKVKNIPETNVRKLDVSSQKDVRRFAREIQDEFPTINVLINNAGIGGEAGPNMATKPARHSVDGHELIMATNYYGFVYTFDISFFR